ncbi:MAG: hypothetical protein EPN70_05970 [Paraburkholderia sp.]|uniref:hypothetical protein n=1 Tax=Paraburkholderia sp. TaxID=1926495 RepID=UPI0011F5182A|nr:hypothetical protein [Paraburkholderia sp.]TAM06390.1 MAG: hypothetical protein EPN70_05970 [Paraburkholderia sp.]
MSNFEHAAIVAELNAGIDAACDALRAATAAGDSAAADAARTDVSRLVNDLQLAEEMEAAGRADDAAHAKDDLRSASEAVLGGAIDSMNRALLGVGIPFLVGTEEEGIVSAAHNIAAARQRYEQAQRAVVETAAALAHLDGVIGETEAMHRTAVSAFADGDRSEAARQRMAELAECLANLHAARVDARELADGVESGEALRELCIATALLERRQAQVLARVVKQHIEHAEAATTAAYAASDRIGDATDRCLGAGAWAKLLAS